MTYIGQKPANKPVNQTDIEDDAISLAKLAGGTDGNIISYDASGNPVAIATGNDGQVLTSTGAGSPPAFETVVVPTLRPNVSPLIINGSMDVAQRGTSVSTTAGGYKTVDRLQFNTAGATGNATFTQENDAPSNTAFRKSMKISPNATETIDAGKNLLFTYAIEGQDVQVLQHGSASPPKATLSFWVKSSKTGAYCVQVKEESISNESYVLFEYSISQANTWEQKVFSWTGNSAHTLNNDNAMGMRLCFHLACGSDDHRSATTSWVDDSSYRATSNQVNLFDNTSNTWYITGIQFEVGEYTSATIPPFQSESFGDNLKRCMRYYYRQNGESGFASGSAFVQDGKVKSYQYHTSPVPMRVQVSMSLSNASGGIIQLDGGNSDDITSIGGVNSGSPFQQYTLLIITDGSSITDKCGVSIRINSSHYIEANAEL